MRLWGRGAYNRSLTSRRPTLEDLIGGTKGQEIQRNRNDWLRAARTFGPSHRYKGMDKEREKQALNEQLARCRRLSAEFTDGVTVKSLSELADELEQQLRILETARTSDQ
jgi:hypothetical protein